MILPEVVTLLTDVRVETTNNVPSRRQRDDKLIRNLLLARTTQRRYVRYTGPDLVQRHPRQWYLHSELNFHRPAWWSITLWITVTNARQRHLSAMGKGGRWMSTCYGHSPTVPTWRWTVLLSGLMNGITR